MPERLDAVLDDIGNLPGPDAQRLVRVALACQAELRNVTRRLNAIDPATAGEGDPIEHLRDVIARHVYRALRVTGSSNKAASALGISRATMHRYRKHFLAHGLDVPVPFAPKFTYRPQEKTHAPTDPPTTRDPGSDAPGGSGRPRAGRAHRRWPYGADGHVAAAHRSPDARDPACGGDPDRRSAQPSGD